MPPFSFLSFARLVDAIDQGDRERLAEGTDGKVVLLLPNSSGELLRATPTGYPITLSTPSANWRKPSGRYAAVSDGKTAAAAPGKPASRTT